MVISNSGLGMFVHRAEYKVTTLSVLQMLKKREENLPILKLIQRCIHKLYRVKDQSAC